MTAKQDKAQSIIAACRPVNKKTTEKVAGMSKERI
jgi:hypothetical protein